MDKFSNGFTDKSYDDLLNEYAGEGLGSKQTARSAKPSSTDGNFDDIYSQSVSPKPAPKKAPTKKPVIEKQASAEPTLKRRPAPQSTRKTENDTFSASNSQLDLREIKSFDEEMKAKTSTPSKEKSRINDTMEFRKSTPRAEGHKTPIVEKVKSHGNSLNKNRSKKVGKGAQAVLNAFKVNKVIFIGMALCLTVAIIISSIILSCVNDVLAIGRDNETSIEVVLPNGADTNTAVKALKDAGLIKNRIFCTVFIKAMKYRDDNYLPGVYYFTENMGVEKMIKRFKTSSVRGSLISITIPEGFTIDKIFERLEKNNICTAQSLYKTIDDVDFSKEYSFIPSASSKSDCYHVLEGYFFPATYEFEQGADPATVVRAFLNAFQSHWTETYANKADELGMTVDEVVNLASIIEKEGANAKQFTQISSVLHNRLNCSGLYPLLECNSTKDYVTNTISARVTSKSELNAYIANYNTYERERLPAGAICNPGEAAIEAALYPEITHYYFFAHDNKKKIYLAETMEQHEQNLRTIAKINAQNS